jgi:C4-dicarboxylate-specific signal transduction histidine kinase
MMLPLYAKKSLVYVITLPILLLTISVLNNLESPVPDGLQKEALMYYILAVNLINSLLLGFCFYYGYRLNKVAQSKIKDQNALLLEAEKLKSLGIMSAGIAHEIRNPLAIIMLQAHSLLEEASSSETKDDIKKIISSSERIVKIIESLRVYSRQNPDDKAVSVNILENIERAYSLSRDVLHDVVLKIKVPPALHVLSNETEFLQILLNLFRNSVYATKDLESPWVQIETQVQGPMVKILFTDSGPGIKTEEINNLFTPFFTTKPVGSGTGLGLSISRKLAESRGGSLYYDSSAQNTTFVLELPYYKLS